MKKIFEISQLLTWYHTICAEGAEDWWRCWTKSFQTFRFVAVSSPPTTWSRTTDHFSPIILMWFGYFFQIQSHIVNAFFKNNLQSISQANEMRCFLRSLCCTFTQRWCSRVRKVEGHLHACDRSFRSTSWHLSIVFHNFSSVNMQQSTWYPLAE